MASVISRVFSPFPLRKLRDRKKNPNGDYKKGSLDEQSLKYFSPTQDEISFDESQLCLSEKKILSTLPLTVPVAPSPVMRSIGVQTPTLPRRGLHNIPGDATPSLMKRKIDPLKLRDNSTSTHPLRGLIQSLTPRMRKRKCPPKQSIESRPPTPSITPASSMTIQALSYSSTPSPVSWTEDETPFPTNEHTKDLSSITIVEVGAAGLHFGKRSYRDVPVREPLLQDSFEEGDTLEREPRYSRVRRRRRKKRQEPTQRGGGGERGNTLRNKRVSFISDDVRGVTKVCLKKESGKTLGLIIAGGIDKSHRPRVANLRPGSPAAESDLLTIGDYILSVNGETTAGLTHDSVVSLLRNAGERVELEIEYEMPQIPSCGGTVQEKTVSIVLQKENGTFGFTLRGGIATDGVSRPLLVTHVRPDGPAGREGTLKAGDRLVSLDGIDLTRSSLLDAQMAIQDVERSATLGIRFDISVMDTVRSSGSPLLVEIERVPGSPLGLTLNTSKFTNYNIFSANQISGQSLVVVESIRTASIAQRCGALAVGDVVCAVDGLGLDHSTVKEANQILKSGQGSKVTLEIIPNKCHQNLNNRLLSPGLSSPSTFGHRYSIYNTIGPTPPLSSTTRRIQRRLREDSSLSPGRSGVSHPETVQTTLLTEGRSVGLALRPSVDSTFPLVAALDPGGAADKVGVICVGDRILAVNGRSVNGSGVSEVNQMMTNTRPTVIVDVEFDVADSVVPSSGTFSVKLSKLQSCLGIRIVKSKLSKPAELAEEAFLISEIVRGSSAHRSGTLQVGDRLLAVNTTRVDSLTIEETRCVLDQEGDVVTLKIQKDELYAEDSSNYVTYTVQLLRDGGVLGISATGSEEPFEPIYVGGIAPGSVAAQTGAIHVGDRLLAINGFSLRGKPLSEAVRLLQGPEQAVALKISRPKDTNLVTPNGLSQDWMGFHGPPTLSGDSAVESWDSGGLDQQRESNDTSHIDRSTSPDIFRSNCGSTVRRKLNSVTAGSDGENSKEIRKSWGSGPSSDSGQSEDNTDWDKMIADLNQISATCGLNGDKALASTLIGKSESLVKNSSWSNINSASNSIDEKIKSSSEPSISAFKFSRRTASPDLPDEGAYSVTKAAATHRATSPASSEDTLTSLSKVFTVTLAKDPFYEDFGFSLSDGLYEKGVYVNRIRKGGPADRTGLLRPYDRILQVNDNQTDDFDCCLTVPLIASAEDTLYLKISRPSAPPISLVNELRLNAWLEAEDEDSGVTSPSYIKDLT